MKKATYSQSYYVENCGHFRYHYAILIDIGNVSHYKKDREKIKTIVKDVNFVEIYVYTSIEECERRDVKGLYKTDVIDVSRGNMIVRSNIKPNVVQDLEVMLCWLNRTPSKPREKYTIHHTSNQETAMIKEIIYKIDIKFLDLQSDGEVLNMNDICKVKIRTTTPLMIDTYRENRTTGSIILVNDANMKLWRQG